MAAELNVSALSLEENSVMRATFKLAMLRAADIIDKITEDDVLEQQARGLREGMKLEQVAKMDRAMIASTYLRYHSDMLRLSTGKDGRWICDVPVASGAIVENSQPCRTYDANTREITESAIIARLRQLNGYEVARIKAELRKFDSTRKVWKP